MIRRGVALGLIVLAGCSSSDTTATTMDESTVAVSVTTSQPAVSEIVTTTTDIGQPDCSMYLNEVCPPQGADPRLACVPDCDGLDLSGLVAPGLSVWVSFANADLSGADFSGAFVDGWVLRGANLTGARFEGADMLNVKFEDQTAVGASFRSSSMYQTAFCGVDLTNAIFDEAVLESASFIRSTLNGVSFAAARTLTEEEWIANGASGNFGVEFVETSIDGVVPSVNFGPTSDAESKSDVTDPCSELFWEA